MRYSPWQLTLKYANRSSYLGGAVLLLFVGAMFTPWFVPTLVRDVRLTLYGKTTQAVVKNKHIALAMPQPVVVACLFAHGGGRRRSCYVSYEFTVGGTVFGRTESVSSAIFNDAQIGQPLEVVYLPTDPNVCRAGEPIWQAGVGLFFGIGLAACIGAIVCLVAGIRDVRGKVRLIAKGQPALGIVDHVEIGYRKRRPYVRSVTYTYLVAHDGRPQTHRATVEKNVPYRPHAVKPGDVIVVVLDPLDPDRHEIDCFAARDEDKRRLLTEADAIHLQTVRQT